MADKHRILTDETGKEILGALQDLVKSHDGTSTGQEYAVEYGVRWVVGASSPSYERVIRQNGVISVWDVDFTPNIGTAISENPFDYIDLFSPELWTDAGGNRFRRFKRFYIGKQRIGNYMYEWVCRKPVAMFYHLPRAFYRAGKPYWNYVDISVYEGGTETVGGTNYLCSKPGYALACSLNRTTAFNQAKAWNSKLNIDTAQEYYLITTMSEITEILQPLLKIIFATKNSQSVYRGVADVNTDKYSVVYAETNTTRILLANESGIAEQFPVGCCVSYNDDFIRKVIGNGTVSVGGATRFYLTLDGASFSTSTDAYVYRVTNSTGLTDTINATHGTISNDGTHSFKVLGIENIYGNIWKHILDCTIYNYTPYVCEDITAWSDTTTPHTNSAFKPCSYQVSKSYGYVKDMGSDESYSDIELPVTVGGSTATYYSDYYWISNGARTVFFGGDLISGGNDGLFFWDLNDSVGRSDWILGARLSHRSL